MPSFTIGKPPPILDFSAFYADDSHGKAKLVEQVRDCCLHNGFFQVTGHGLPLDLQKRALSCGRRFFLLPMQEKLKLDKKQNKYGRGYEAVRSYQAELGTDPDLKEDFSIGREIPKDHPSCLQGKLGCGPNLWPENIDNREEFQKTTMEYFNSVYRLAEDIVTVLSLSLGLDANHLDGLKNEPRVGVMKYQYYPQLPEGADLEVTRGFGAHTDFCPLAIILQDGIPGLQVLDEPTGEWVTIEPVPGAFVVNLGESFTELTNGQYKSSIHRVINNPDSDRLSVPFFFNGDPDYLLAPLPICQGSGDEAKTPPRTIQQLVLSRVQERYARVQK
ncbi:isopenicillin N synthase family dioxygenase [Aspergillus puulaauensis]|uniref:Fe2OG dioxygenase domain-containing protein n=1 Tax=Aspergillus puulaauensis TaxID=1220207 RepID=A0A7R8AU92_9EURO|nr:uncharacterized protein APUU_71248S [Aspergillus puulaauensis]BCS29678.1 hypothetical protein APUU_71248S [Aspergillus puulaauensis]